MTSGYSDVVEEDSDIKILLSYIKNKNFVGVSGKEVVSSGLDIDVAGEISRINKELFMIKQDLSNIKQILREISHRV